MALDNYTNLQTAIITHAWRTGSSTFAPLVPDLIRLTEDRLNSELRVGQMETSATLALTNGAAALPANFLEVRTASAGDYSLSLAPLDYAKDRLPGSGTPIYYTLSGSQITTFPSGTGNLSLLYYAKIPNLGPGTATNWLLTDYPGVYLYGALSEAASYMMDDNRIPVWESRFADALKNLKSRDAGARYANSRAFVSGPTP